MRFCTRCGNQIGDHDKFCDQCGFSVEYREDIASKEELQQKSKKKVNHHGWKIVGIMLLAAIAVALTAVVGILALRNKEQTLRFTEKNGSENITEDNYAEEDLLPVLQNGVWGYENLQGKIRIKSQYDYAGDFQENGLAIILKNGKYGCIDKKGNEIVKRNYDYMDEFADNELALVREGDKYGYIDSKGNIQIPLIYDKAESFGSDGLAFVTIGERAGYIDGKNSWVEEFGLETQAETEKGDNWEASLESTANESESETWNEDVWDMKETESEWLLIGDSIYAPLEDFVFPYSSNEYITDEQLETLIRDNVDDMNAISQRAINEILARYGYVFKEGTSRTAKEAYEYFNAKDWYLQIRGKCEYETANDLIANMNEVEKGNIDRINRWQMEHDCYY